MLVVKVIYEPCRNACCIQYVFLDVVFASVRAGYSCLSTMCESPELVVFLRLTIQSRGDGGLCWGIQYKTYIASIVSRCHK